MMTVSVVPQTRPIVRTPANEFVFLSYYHRYLDITFSTGAIYTAICRDSAGRERERGRHDVRLAAGACRAPASHNRR